MPPPLAHTPSSSSRRDLGSDDEWQCTMGSDSDVDEPDPSAKLSTPAVSQPPTNPPLLDYSWDGDDVESYVEDVPLDSVPTLASLTFQSRQSFSPPDATPPSNHPHHHRTKTLKPPSTFRATVTRPLSEPSKPIGPMKPGPCFLFPTINEPRHQAVSDEDSNNLESHSLGLSAFAGSSRYVPVSDSPASTPDAPVHYAAAVQSVSPAPSGTKSPPSPHPETPEHAHATTADAPSLSKQTSTTSGNSSSVHEDPRPASEGACDALPTSEDAQPTFDDTQTASKDIQLVPEDKQPAPDDTKPISESSNSIPVRRVSGLPNFVTGTQKTAPANMGSSDSDLQNPSEPRSEMVPNSIGDTGASHSASAEASSSKSGSLRGRAERKVSGLRQSIRNRARLGSMSKPLGRRNRPRTEQRNDTSFFSQSSASRSKGRTRSRGPSFNFGRSTPLSDAEQHRSTRPQSTPAEGLATREIVGPVQEADLNICPPSSAKASHCLSSRDDVHSVVFEKVVVQQALKPNSAPSNSFRPVTKDHSFLECFAEALKGAHVQRKKNIVQGTEARLWLRSDMKALEYRLLKKGSVPKQHDIILSYVRKVKGTDRDLQFDVVNEKKPVEFVFRTAKELDIWLSALSRLVPEHATVKKNHKRIENRWDYNPLHDTWNDNKVSERKMVRELMILGTIGTGMTAKVKAALSSTERRFYAVKVIAKSALWKARRMGGHLGVRLMSRDDNMSMEDLEEPRVLKDLRHENVVELYAVFEDEENGMFYYVTEYLPSGPVMRSHNLQTEKRLSEERARSAFVDVLAGLEYLHRNNVVHRDIKPDNLLSCGDGSVKISDFGEAIKYSSEEEREEGVESGKGDGGRNMNIGTPAFTAPELCSSEHAPSCPEKCFAADIWSLGATLFYFLYGRPPHMEKTVLNMYDVICTETLLFPSNPTIPVSLQTLLRRMLAKKPEERATIKEIVKSPWLGKDVLISEKVAKLRKRVESNAKR